MYARARAYANTGRTDAGMTNMFQALFGARKELATGPVNDEAEKEDQDEVTAGHMLYT